jgi:peroxiredoxin
MRYGLLMCTVWLAVLLSMSAFCVSAQDQPKADKLTEVEQLKFQLTVEHQKRLQAEYDVQIQRCRQHSDVAALITESEKVSKEQTDLLLKFFTDHNVDVNKFRLDPQTFEFREAK